MSKITEEKVYYLTHLFESIIGGHFVRAITLPLTLTELWPFLNLGYSTLSRLLIHITYLD
jgi:hypothetical protein